MAATLSVAALLGLASVAVGAAVAGAAGASAAFVGLQVVVSARLLPAFRDALPELAP